MYQHKLVSELITVAPHLHIKCTRERDEYFRWDGDGPDPEEDGFEPCTVKVTASYIADGQLFSDDDYLGGSYFKPGEHTGDVHGYFSGMVQECVQRIHDEIALQLPNCAADHLELENALNAISEHMQAEYDAQRAGIAAQ